MNYNKLTNDRLGQVPNSAGGYSFATDKWQQLNRFLILGSDAGTYYINAKDLTLQNAKVVLECLKEDGKRTVDAIVEISDSGRAVKNSPAIYALALAATPKYNSKFNLYALDNLSRVCRTGTHLFEFMEYITELRGMGRGLRSRIADWYLEKKPRNLAFSVTKYAQRNGWSHRDVLRLVHPKTDDAVTNAIFKYITEGVLPEEYTDGASEYLSAVEQVKKAESSTEVVRLINEYQFPWEVIPSQWHNDPDVRMTLLYTINIGAMVRQLGIYSGLQLTQMKSEGERIIVDNLNSEEAIKRSRIHPFQILLALQTYGQGRGIRGSNTWAVNPRITEALENAFYKSFANVTSSDKRVLLGIDISGSMSSNIISGLNNIRATYGAAALALMMVNTENYCDTVAFDDRYEERPLNRRNSIQQTMQQFQPRGNTDCGKVIEFARDNNRVYDVIQIFTDSETWKGKSNPYKRFQEYRQKFNPDCKLVTVAMTSNSYTLGPQDDPNVFDCVGFDADLPVVISEFTKGAF